MLPINHIQPQRLVQLVSGHWDAIFRVDQIDGCLQYAHVDLIPADAVALLSPLNADVPD